MGVLEILNFKSAVPKVWSNDMALIFKSSGKFEQNIYFFRDTVYCYKGNSLTMNSYQKPVTQNQMNLLLKTMRVNKIESLANLIIKEELKGRDFFQFELRINAKMVINLSGATEGMGQQINDTGYVRLNRIIEHLLQVSC